MPLPGPPAASCGAVQIPGDGCYSPIERFAPRATIAPGVHEYFFSSTSCELNLRSHLRATIRLAAPVMVSRLGILTIVAADTAMTGWAGTRELAALAISAAPHTPLLLIGVGLCTGTIVLASQAEGAGSARRPGSSCGPHGVRPGSPA